MNKIKIQMIIKFQFLIVFSCLISGLYGESKKSLVIGIDGLGYGENGFEFSKTPNMNSLIDGSWAQGYKGAYFDKAYSGGIIGTITEQTTKSGPGWSTILTGVWGNRHNVVMDNLFLNADFEKNPTYLETLEELIPDIFSISIDSWSEIYNHIIPSVNDSNSSIDIDTSWWGGDWWKGNYFYNAGDTSYFVPVDGRALSTTISYLAELDSNPAAVFVQFVSVDWAGHWWGGSSSVRYKNEIEEVDSLIGDILSTIQNRTHFSNESWQIILTSDHGHLINGGHGGQSELERRVPFIISSKELIKGTLDYFNTNVSIADVAPSVLDHFGLDIPDRYAGISRAKGFKKLYTNNNSLPSLFLLKQNYPNPFNPTTTLHFDLPEVSDVNMVIYNMLGQKVRTFNMNSISAGSHSIKWNATNDLGDSVGAGVYLYQLQTKDFVKTRKMVLLK
tara:strand:- start:88 stop:1425 length:1338 start_codon:yes stop_codon:yes gene_type:complete